MPRINDVVAERGQRRQEGVRLYRCTPEAEPFHRSTAKRRIVRGGNRAGKTIATSAEVAAACLRTPLKNHKGETLPLNYPADRPLLVWIIGIDEAHLGRIYGKLFRKGAFRVIRDEKSGRLRTWKPWVKRDYERRKETEPSPPFIPARMIDKEHSSWNRKAAGIPELITLKNGTRIHFFPSGGVPGMGDPVDILFIDEDVRYPEYVPEWLARLPDAGNGTTLDGRWVEGGQFIWSAWPHDNNDALQTMSRLAADERGKEDPIAFEVVLHFTKNRHIGTKQKKEQIATWGVFGPAVIAARDRGEFITDSVRWFPNFSIDIHGVPRKAGPDPLEEALSQNGLRIPKTWTNYVTIDPGHTNNIALLVAIPPPIVGDYYYVWREIYLEGGSADMLAAEIKRIAWDCNFEAFVLDDHASRQSYMGMGGYKIRDHYSEAFDRQNLSSRMSGSKFLHGSDDIVARNLLVKSWMDVRPDGTTKFRINAAHCPRMIREFDLYKKRIQKNEADDKEVNRYNHCMSANGYLATRNPKWIPPEVFEQDLEHPMDRLLKALPFGIARQPQKDSFTFGAGSVRS